MKKKKSRNNKNGKKNNFVKLHVLNQNRQESDQLN